MREAFLFLEQHFLHWVEAMSLLGVVSGVVGMLGVLLTVMPVSICKPVVDICPRTNEDRVTKTMQYLSSSKTQSTLC
jgi:hypothetical protein